MKSNACCACLFLLLPVPLLAQSPPSTVQAPAAAQPVQEPRWRGGLIIGTSWESGVTRQTGFNLQGELFRSSPKWNHYARAVYVFSRVKVGEIKATVADAQNVRYIVERSLTPRTYLAFSPAFKRNEVQHVDYRAAESFGFGFRAVTETNLKISVVPFVSLTQQKVNVDRVDGLGGAVGFLQSVEWKINAVWSASEDIVFMQDTATEENRRIQARASVSGVIRKPWGLNVSYSFDRENVVLAGSEKADQRLSVGIQMSF